MCPVRAPLCADAGLLRSRSLVVHTRVTDVSPKSTEMQLEMPHGVQLSFAEPDRDIVEPAGVLTIEPIPESESIWT